jgi:alkyl hydroperoxide reductase subunit AhpC
VAQLCQHLEEIKRLNTEIVVISFSERELGKRWLEETCAPFVMLIDQERKVYQAYGMKRSFFGTWNPGTILFYIRMFLVGRKWHGIQGDPNQMGGDFIIDKNGTLILVYPSEEATDRPPVEGLFDILRELNEGIENEQPGN